MNKAANAVSRMLHSYDDEETKQLAKSIANTMYRYHQTDSRRVPTLRDLQDDHVKQFWEQGYLVVDSVLNDREVAVSIEALMDIIFGKFCRIEGSVRKAERKLEDGYRERTRRPQSVPIH